VINRIKQRFLPLWLGFVRYVVSWRGPLLVVVLVALAVAAPIPGIHWSIRLVALLVGVMSIGFLLSAAARSGPTAGPTFVHQQGREGSLSAPDFGHMPRTSLIITAYNDERFIGPCLESVLAYDATDVEVLVVLDAGTDATERLVAEVAATDRRVRVIAHEDNFGLAAARNTGLAHDRPFVGCASSGSRRRSSRRRRIVLRLGSRA
jgi:hypothetical protein